jgi:hypothetical protein
MPDGRVFWLGAHPGFFRPGVSLGESEIPRHGISQARAALRLLLSFKFQKRSLRLHRHGSTPAPSQFQADDDDDDAFYLFFQNPKQAPCSKLSFIGLQWRITFELRVAPRPPPSLAPCCSRALQPQPSLVACFYRRPGPAESYRASTEDGSEFEICHKKSNLKSHKKSSRGNALRLFH